MAVATSLGFFCIAPGSGLRGQAKTETSAEQEARNQIGKFTQNQVQGAMPGPNHTLADTKHALLTADAIFAAYVKVPLLSPPRGFELMHNSNADARNTPRGWPIPAGSGFIMLAYDSKHRLPTGRFAIEGEGPVLGGFAMNTIDCDNRADEKNLGADEKGPFYLMAKQTGTVHGWPQFGGEVFMSKRTKPRWLPVSMERILKVQLARARKTLEDVNAASPQTAYKKWMSEKEKRLQGYQKAHDDMVKALGKEKADAMLATMLDADKKTESMYAGMAQQGSDTSKMVAGFQAQSGKSASELEARLNSLSAEQKNAPAYVYLATDGKFQVDEVVPEGTTGGVAVVYPNPDFYDRTLPPWEAQSVCVAVSTGPVSQQHFLYPTIVNIWASLDWDAIAQILK